MIIEIIGWKRSNMETIKKAFPLEEGDRFIQTNTKRKKLTIEVKQVSNKQEKFLDREDIMHWQIIGYNNPISPLEERDLLQEFDQEIDYALIYLRSANFTLGRLGNTQKDHYKAARVAIEAMREPLADRIREAYE
jgi:hypothetical protein